MRARRRAALVAGAVALPLGLMVSVIGTAGASNPTSTKSAIEESDIPDAPAAKGGPVNVGYFAQWGIYGRNFRIKDADTSGELAKLTHLNYAFGNVSQDGKCFEVTQQGQGDAWADYQTRFTADQSIDGKADAYDQPLAGNFNQIKKAKAKYPKLRALMSLGGWTWSKYFSNAALPQNRQAFVASCIDLFVKGNLPKIGGEPQGGAGVAAGVFDGIDLDWEWPGSPGNDGNVVRPEDKANYAALVAEFRKQLDALGKQTHKSYLLTAFLPADKKKIDAGIDVKKVLGTLSWGNIQGYDFHGGWEANQTNHQANLYARKADPAPAKYSINLAIKAYLARGAKPSKLAVGVALYGRGWTGVGKKDNGLWQSATGPAPGTYELGIEDYKKLKARNLPSYYDPKARASWLYNGTEFWSIDDPRSIAAKGAYVKQKGLRGLFGWELDGDDGSLIAAMNSSLK